MKQLNVCLVCFPPWQTKCTMRMKKMAAEISGDSVESRIQAMIPLIYHIMTVFSYKFNLDIRFYRYTVIPTLAVCFTFTVLPRFLLSRSAERYCSLCLTEEAKTYSGRIIETKQIAEPTYILWLRNGTMPI